MSNAIDKNANMSFQVEFIAVAQLCLWDGSPFLRLGPAWSLQRIRNFVASLSRQLFSHTWSGLFSSLLQEPHIPLSERSTTISGNRRIALGAGQRSYFFGRNHSSRLKTSQLVYRHPARTSLLLAFGYLALPPLLSFFRGSSSGKCQSDPKFSPLTLSVFGLTTPIL